MSTTTNSCPVMLLRNGNFVSVAAADGGATPVRLAQQLHSFLGYQYRRHLRGLDAIDPHTGQHRAMIIERRSLYTRDQLGRVTTFAGFIPRMAKIIAEQYGGVMPLLYDLTPPPPRQNWDTAVWENLAGLELRYRQMESLENVVAHDRGVFNCSMGFGKSFLFGAVAKLYPHAKIAVVVPGSSTFNSVFRELLKFIPLPGRVGDSRRDVQRVTVYMPDSLHHCDGDVDILLVDEAEKCMATQLREKLFATAAKTRKTFAFSGTPYSRLDGASACLEAIFGQEIMKVTNEELVANHSVTPIHVHWLPIIMRVNPCGGYKSSVKRLQVGIWRNAERNAQIASFVQTHYGNPDIQVLISVATIEHAVHLWHYLPEYTLAYAGKDYAYFEERSLTQLLPANFQPLSRQLGAKLQEDFSAGRVKKVIATDIWSTGCNFPQLQVLVRADARESEGLNLQWAARPNRKFDDKHLAVMVDCLDLWDTGFQRKSHTRRGQYRKQGHTETWPDVAALKRQLESGG